ncbi:MAG: CvpA family protein [Roseburia sp.]
MNWLLIVVLVIIILSTYHGYRKGFLRMLYSLVAWILIFVFVSWTTPYIADYLTKQTSIAERIKAECVERLKSTAEEKIEEEGKETGSVGTDELGIHIPDSLLEKLQEQMTGTAGEILEQSGIYDGIAETLTQFIIKGIAFFVALIIAAILSWVIRCLLGFVSEIPVIHGVNQGVGTVVGALYGLIFIWIGMYLIALCCTSEVGRLLYSYIQESRLLVSLYENNPIFLLF